MTASNSTVAAMVVQKKPMPRWFKILSLLSFIALVLVMGGILFTERWVEVVDDHLADLKAHRVEEAYYQHTSRDFQSSTSLDSFKAFVEQHTILSNHLSTHFTERSINHNISTLSGKITAMDHQTLPIEYRLIREDGNWKILSIRFLERDLTTK